MSGEEHTPQFTQYVTWEEDSPDTSSMVQHLFKSPDPTPAESDECFTTRREKIKSDDYYDRMEETVKAEVDSVFALIGSSSGEKVTCDDKSSCSDISKLHSHNGSTNQANKDDCYELLKDSSFDKVSIKRRLDDSSLSFSNNDSSEIFSPGQKITRAVLQRRARRVSADTVKHSNLSQTSNEGHVISEIENSHFKQSGKFSSLKKFKKNIVTINKASSGKKRSHMFEAMMREIEHDIGSDPIREAVNGCYTSSHPTRSDIPSNQLLNSPLVKRVNDRLRDLHSGKGGTKTSPSKTVNINNKTSSSSPFSGVDFDDDAFAMMDALVEQRILEQKETSDYGQSEKLKISGLTDDIPSTEKACNAEATSSPDPFGHLPDIDFEAMDQFVLSARNYATNESSNNIENRSEFARFSVTEVYEDSNSYIKSLRVIPYSVGSDDVFIGNVHDNFIHLRGEWYYSNVEKGSVVHLLSVYGRNKCDFQCLPVTLHTDVVDDVNDDLLIIINPDLLVSPSNISESSECVRRSVLKARMGSSGLSSKAAILGTMRHDLFQACMRDKVIDYDFVKSYADRIIRCNAENLVGCSLDESEALHELMLTLPQIRSFFETYVQDDQNNKHLSILSGPTPLHQSVYFLVNKTFATEQQVVVPELGMRGFIDATVESSLEYVQQNGVQYKNPRVQGLMPLELKTGHYQKFQVGHGAQLSLYSLMMKVRYGVKIDRGTLSSSQPNQEEYKAIDGGVLLYLNGKGVQASYVPPSFREIKSLVSNRNIIAFGLQNASRPRGVHSSKTSSIDEKTEFSSIEILPATPAELPQCIGQQRQCYRCYSNKECSLYARTELLRSQPQSSLQQNYHNDVIGQLTNHLSNYEIEYFMKWDRMIDLEVNEANHNIIQSWLIPSQDRERLCGVCLSSLEWDSDSIETIDHLDKDSSVVLKFFRTSSLSLTPNPTQLSQQYTQQNFSSLKLNIGDHVVISSDNGVYGVKRGGHETRGFRSKMHIVRGIVKVILDTSIFITSSIGEMNELKDYESSSSRFPNASLPKYRLDKDEIITSAGGLRQNLVKLLTADIPSPVETKKGDERENLKLSGVPEFLSPRLQRLRNLVIKMVSPTFCPNLVSTMFAGPASTMHNIPFELKGCNLMDLVAEFHDLNVDQRQAVEKIVTAKDYAIIQGMPGTGKTSVIAFVARLLAAQGKRVLITSYTHAAVDNLLIKLIEAGMEPGALLRIGKKAACHFAVYDLLASTLAIRQIKNQDDCLSASSLNQSISNARIIGVTALTCTRSPLLVKQHFDVVICDEAGQLTQPATLGPLMSADSFILVGDHQQLPPLVVSTAAEKAGYAVSLMLRLAEARPESVIKLTQQYRMNGHISEVCNRVMYKGALKCATKSVESSRLLLGSFPSNLPKLQRLPLAISSTRQGMVKNNCIDFLRRIIDPSEPVVFVNTDTSSSPKSSIANLANRSSSEYQKDDVFRKGLEKSFGRRGSGGNIVNDFEVELVKLTVSSLLKCGAKPSDIGIISPFRSQVRRLGEDHVLSRIKNDGMEISTIDKFQGRDKSIMILSLVRSNAHGKAGRLLNDPRRINVAVSRAKHKLVLIGSSWTLKKGSETLSSLIDLMERKGWVLDLPENDNNIYNSSSYDS